MSEEQEEKSMVATIVSGLFQLGMVIWREVSEFKTASAEQRKKNEERSRAAFERMRDGALTFVDRLNQNDREADAIAAETDRKKATVSVVASPPRPAFDTSDVGTDETPTVAGPPPKPPTT